VKGEKTGVGLQPLTCGFCADFLTGRRFLGKGGYPCGAKTVTENIP